MAAALLTGALVAAVAWGTTPVREVLLEAPGAPVERLRQYFGVTPSQPLSRLEIRRGVQALIASGLVEDVVVTVEEEGGQGPILKVRAQTASRIAAIVVTGLERRHERLVRETLDLSPSVPLHVAAFERAVQRAEAALKADGYPQAWLEPSLEFERATETVTVRVVGSAGPALRAGAIEAPGSGLAEAVLWRRSGLKAGARLSQRALSEARVALLRSLRRAGYWEAEVGQPRTSGPLERATVLFEVELGPKYRLELRGEKLGKSLRQAALPFLSGAEGFSEATLEATVKAVRCWAQRDGRFLASVEGRLRGTPTERVLELDAHFGPRLRIAAVEFPGAEGVDRAFVLSRVAVRQGKPGRLRGEPVDEETLAQDAASVRAALIREGYAHAEVGTPRILPANGGVRIEIPVTLGERTRVGEVQVVGVPEDVPVPPLPLVAGGPWSVAGEEATRELLADAVAEAGYADAQVSSERSCSGTACSVTVTVVPGNKVMVGRLVVAGLGKTRPDVVDRMIRLEPGSVFTPKGSLEATRRLVSLGVFKRATTRRLPGLEVGPTRDIVLDVLEAPTRSVGFGLGWDTEARTSVSLNWSETSLFGTARTLAVDGRYSAREARWQVSFREPAELGLLGVPVWVSVFRTDENYDTYRLLRRGMWVEFGDRRRLPRRALLRYDYQVTQPEAPDELLSELERGHQRAKIASLTPILEYDSRDDVFEPHRGVQASLQYQNAFPLFDADAAFQKLTLLGTAYTPVGPGVLVGSTRLGAIEPKDGDAAVPKNLRLPIAVRYFAGGRISHRAFPIDRLGIVGETLDSNGDPLGGTGLALVNLEWRFPLAGSVGGAVFLDGGNVWGDWRSMDVAQLRWGAGLGVRVGTPIGPVRLEYGWKLDRQRGESAGELFFAFGNPF